MDKGRRDAEETKKTGSVTGVHEYPGTQDAQNIQESLSEIARQVWPLTEGAQAIKLVRIRWAQISDKSMTPCWGNTILFPSSQQQSNKGTV